VTSGKPPDERDEAAAERSLPFAKTITSELRVERGRTSEVTGRRRRMTTHKTGTRDQWLTARLDLLDAEKALTRLSDAVAEQRQDLPWVRVDKDYRFDTHRGQVTLADLFQGRSQLLVYHFMFGPEYPAGCISCSAIADGFNGIAIHLANHDVTLWAASLAPLPKLLAFRQRMGWTFPWASSQGGDFNHDFNVSITEEQQRGGTEYNYRRSGHATPDAPLPSAANESAIRTGAEPTAYGRQRPGMSAFVLEGGVVYHTYSTYARGLDGLWGMFQWLDRAPRGRNQGGVWWQHHDRYQQTAE
jgi:predicted dithiol-disulfide oxidoreductase (DUF899 family)